MRIAQRRAAPHVVVVTPELWGVTRENGGISTSVFHFARLFSRRGDRVTVLVGLAKESGVAEEWARRYDAEGIEIRTAVASWPSHDASDRFATDSPFGRVAEAVADAFPADADVVYFQDWCGLGVTALQRRELGLAASHAPTVTVLRGSSAWARPGSDLPADEDGSRRALDRAERSAVELSDFVVSPSRSYRDHLRDSGVRLPGGARTRVLPHPWLPLAGSRAVGPPGRAFRRLVYFGRLDTWKGLDLFLDALAELARGGLLRGLDQIVFMGREGEHRRGGLEHVAAEVAGHGLESVFPTDLDSCAVVEALSDLAPDGLVVVPSLRENFPNAVIEASLVEGLNAIYSNVGGVPQIVGSAGRRQLFVPETGALATMLVRWLERGPRRAGELASYDWRKANSDWLAFHEEVLGARIRTPRPTSPRLPLSLLPGRAARPRSMSVVVSTYEWPEALNAVLRGLAEQSDPDFEVVVADDGSGAGTEAMVDSWRAAFGDRLARAWQPDEGFRLARALDLAALACRGDWLVFINGDSVPRRHFVRALRAAFRAGWFVAGRRIQLSRALTASVLGDGLPVHRWSAARWLRFRSQAGPVLALTNRDRRRVGARRLPPFEPVDRGYGYLLGVGRGEFERVNGYDTRFVGWGEEDVDLAVRLQRLGLRCGHGGPQATLLHLWHESLAVRDRPNWWLLRDTEQSDRIEARVGLRELASESGGTQVSANRVGASSSSREPVYR